MPEEEIILINLYLKFEFEMKHEKRRSHSDKRKDISTSHKAIEPY